MKRMAPLIATIIFIHSAVAARAFDEPWTLTRGIELVSRWPRPGGIGEDRVTAELYRPPSEGRRPAAVIINSSGGVQPHTELHYARLLVRAGMAAFVVDSFGPRGVRETGTDQNRVPQMRSNADAVAGFRFLAAQPFVDPQRIVVMGMSRGGEAALANALSELRPALRSSDIRFAAHIAIATGGCNIPRRDARTTGAPVFFMLAELDDVTPILSCIDLATRMRAAGNPSVRLAVYPGVYHAYEGTSGVRPVPNDWNAAGCSGRFWAAPDGLRDRRTNALATPYPATDYLFRTCMTLGYTVGGDERVKAQASGDLLQFLRDADVLHDAEARALLPECAAYAGAVARNCVRGRNGWTADIVALARAHREATGAPRDDGRAAALFALGADRGHSEAWWQLSLMHRLGQGVARDMERALAFARRAADAGAHAGMNILGLHYREGWGVPRDDREATKWFRRAAELRNPFGMTNYGRMLWLGRGVERDRAAAVGFWREAIVRSDVPWSALYLAEAHETGDGAPRDLAEARRLYGVAAAQDRDLDAKRQAEDRMRRLAQ
jgi:TPR repeat protein/dienelactone hydrolase